MMIFLFIVVILDVTQMFFAFVFFLIYLNHGNVNLGCRNDIDSIIAELIRVFLSRIIVFFRNLLTSAIWLTCQSACLSHKSLSYWFWVFELFIFGQTIALWMKEINFSHVVERLLANFGLCINSLFENFDSTIQVLILFV